MTKLRYAAGSATIVVRDNTALLVHAEVPPLVTERVWSLLAAGRPDIHESVLDLLTATYGLRALPEFALMSFDPPAAQVTVRGGLEVAVSRAQGVEQFGARPGGPWSTSHVTGVHSLEIAADEWDASDPPLLLVEGVARAAGLHWSVEDAAMISDLRVPIESDDIEYPVAATGAVATSPGRTASASEGEPSTPEDAAVDVGNDSMVTDELETAPVVEPHRDSSDEPTEAEEDETGYTTLFRRHRLVPDPAVPMASPAESEEAPEDRGDERDMHEAAAGSLTQVWDDSSSEVDEVPEPEVQRPKMPDPPASVGGLIDGIPGFSPGCAPTADPGVLTPSAAAPSSRRPTDPAMVDRTAEEEDLGLTIPRPMADSTVRRSTPEVLAVRCPSGHLSPAHAPVCRVCGQPTTAQDPHWVVRPSLGRFHLPGGETLDVDRGVVFGRAPHEPPGAPERPHLVNISSYGPHLSRMHLEVVLDGWFVMVRDLGSTSGTVLTIPGHNPERLRAQELVTLQPGSVLDLAGDYEVRFEVAQ